MGNPLTLVLGRWSFEGQAQGRVALSGNPHKGTRVPGGSSLNGILSCEWSLGHKMAPFRSKWWITPIYSDPPPEPHFGKVFTAQSKSPSEGKFFTHHFINRQQGRFCMRAVTMRSCDLTWGTEVICHWLCCTTWRRVMNSEVNLHSLLSSAPDASEWIASCSFLILSDSLWSSGKTFWLEVRVRFPALPDFLRSSGSGTGSTQPREYNWPPLWSSGQSSWLQIQRSGFDSRHYQIFWEVVGLERGPLSLGSIIDRLWWVVSFTP
jgi:hypothetical protein